MCDLGPYVTTAHNEIFVQTKRQSKSILVVRVDSVGATGVPLSWNGQMLIIHLPSHYHGSSLQVLHLRVAGGVTLSFVRDYSDDQQLGN